MPDPLTQGELAILADFAPLWLEPALRAEGDWLSSRSRFLHVHLHAAEIGWFEHWTDRDNKNWFRPTKKGLNALAFIEALYDRTA